jgi:hypothetical protein
MDSGKANRVSRGAASAHHAVQVASAERRDARHTPHRRKEHRMNTLFLAAALVAALPNLQMGDTDRRSAARPERQALSAEQPPQEHRRTTHDALHAAGGHGPHGPAPAPARAPDDPHRGPALADDPYTGS